MLDSPFCYSDPCKKFLLNWTDSNYAINYTIFVNDSAVVGTEGIIETEFNVSISEDGIYGLYVVAFNDYGNISSNEVSITLNRAPSSFQLSSTAKNPDKDGDFVVKWTEALNIKNYTFLNLMELKASSEERKNHSIIMFKNIVNNVSATLFNNALKLQLIDFLSIYIEFLFENLKRDIPRNIDDKFKILIFQDILNLDESDMGKIRRELYQITPILRSFPKYKILEELKKRIEDSNFD